MPQYILPEMEAPEFKALSPFVQGYIQAMFFTNQSNIAMTEWHTEESQELIREGQADGEFPNDAGFTDLHPDSLVEIIRDCEAFQREAGDDLTEALDNARIDGYDEESAGMDFWYTRVGHGVGYWDRGLGGLGDILTAVAKRFGEVWPYFSDPAPDSPTGYGWVYHS